MILAERGRCSQIRTPGTLVAMLVELAAHFRGASGFMSQVS